jgi:hypothetical protein
MATLTLGAPAGPALAASTHGATLIAQAKKGLLVLSDMPKGWTSSKSENNNSPTPAAAQLARCLGVPTSVVTSNPPTAYSRTFTSKNGVESVFDDVAVYSSARAARVDYDSGTDPKAPACLTANFNGPGRAQIASSFGPGAVVGNIAVTRVPASDFAPHNANIAIFLPVTSQEETLNVELVEAVYVKGREEQTVTLSTIVPPFPSSLSRHLTAVADGRL